MVKILTSIFAAASAAQLKWTDCGDADTFVTIVGLDPEDIAIPGKTSLTGSGFLSADESGGQFKFVGKAAGVQVISGGGNLCEDNTITLPDGAGTVQFHALDCPFQAGQIDIKLDLDLTGAVANDLINIELSALSTSGDKLLCMEIETNGVAEAAAARPDCSGAACSDSCECSYTSCSDEVDACLAEPNCASSQDCAFACACNDDACLLKCAASSPSLKALPLAKCITSKCSSLKAAARPDCSGAACSDSCECSYTSCSDEVDACLAQPNCASSQDCAFACACNDDACLLKCAASSPSVKALPLAKCITSKCSTAVV